MNEQLKIQILLFFYERRKLVGNALRSIAAQTYSNYEVAFIDDSEYDPRYVSSGEDIFYGNKLGLDGRYILYQTKDTKADKLARGGSQFGRMANLAMANSNADICIMLCDDDALEANYLKNLNEFFTTNPEINYCYSDVVIYDPLVETYEDAIGRPVDHNHFLNVNKNPHPLGNSKDSSQVAWRRCSNVLPNLFPWPLTVALDYHVYNGLCQQFGVGYYSGFTGQYKGWHEHQLGRTGSYDIRD